MVKKALNIITIIFTVFAATIYCNAQTPLLYSVKRMPFNTNSFNDMSPVIGKDGSIMFSSDRRLSAITDVTSYDGRRLFNIFQVAAGADTISGNRVMELKSERTMKFNTGPFCISADGRYIYFTSEVETGRRALGKNFVNRNGIFMAELSGNDMINVKPLPYNSLEYDIGQPSLSTDGKILYFVSNKPGGHGGSDIYYCELVNNEWAEPVNLGSEINSSASESYPYIHPSGILYFSSDRGGIGGFDIYSTIKIDGKWQKPTLMPEPVNSTSDDFAFVITPDRQKGYFTSNRASNDDIYSFTSNIRRLALCDDLQENSYCYQFEEVNAVKVDTTPFRYIWKFGDGATSTGTVAIHCYEKPGAYYVQLDVENLITNEMLYNEKTDTLFITDIEQPYITSSDVATVGEMIKLDANKTYLPGWEIDQYYWNFDDETIQIGNEVEKVYTRPGTYNVQLIVSEKALSGETIRETCICKNIIVSAETQNETLQTQNVTLEK